MMVARWTHTPLSFLHFQHLVAISQSYPQPLEGLFWDLDDFFL
jgi:hypothetical protein